MNIEKANENTVIVKDGMINTVNDILDVLADASYNYRADHMVVYKESLPEQFFELRTGLAGEMLQKLTNYNMRISIVGDFSVYSSKALRDFIYESNKGKQVNFCATEQDALK